KRKDSEPAQKAAAKSPQPAHREASKSPSPVKKLTYKDQRDYDLLPERIEAIDKRMVEIEKTLADPNLYTKDFPQFEKLTQENSALIDEKDSAEMRWLELAEEVERLQNP
ncbi:MAG: ABC transporter C-terminal domain-containing protein, partial [Marinomonas sp.]